MVKDSSPPIGQCSSRARETGPENRTMIRRTGRPGPPCHDPRGSSMRSHVLVKTLVSVTSAVGIAAGGLAGAGTVSAAPAPAEKAAVSAQSVAPYAVVNLGLSTTDAKRLQGKFLRHYGYTGALDGLLGTASWKAMQRLLKDTGDYSGAIDGIVGPQTVKALQRYLKRWHNYTGAIDGIAGPATTAAFTRMARVT